MDFSFTEEQNLLRNSVQRFVQDKYTLEDRRKIVDSEEGMSRDNWNAFAELGLLMAPFAEEYGGLGGTNIDIMVIMEEFGRGLVVEPYLQTVVLAGGFIVEGGNEDQKQKLLPEIGSGEQIYAVAFAEPQGRYNLADITTKAEKSGDGYTLNGYKSVVIGAPWADKLIVTTRSSGGDRDADGVSVFIVDKSADGVSTRDYPTIDGLRASEVTFENVSVGADALLGEEGKGLGLVEKVFDQGIAALCAEACGALRVLTDSTVEYCKTREQFGQPIGKFQVLQHRMVDMFMETEQAVSMTYMVNLKLDDSDVERKKAASAAKVQLGKSGKFIGQSAVQLHGGMGMTDELHIGHFFKRVTMMDALFGNVDHHLKRYSALDT
jgi:alkylation response protein AidB-like acyl-CoA dehydrogenase